MAGKGTGRAAADPVTEVLAETSRLVGQLLRENRTLKAQNEKLAREVARLSKGWEEIKRLARSAPRSPRRS